MGHFRGDCINTNLRLGITAENIIVLPFRRSGYAGRLVIDQTQNQLFHYHRPEPALNSPKKGRKTPHFLQTILGIENSAYESECKQLEFMLASLFDEETLREDFESIIANLFSPNEGYVHYIITYISGRSGLPDVQLLFLDKDFDVIDAQSLNEFIAPDYAELTASQDIPDTSVDTTAEPNVRSIIGVKPGLRPALYDEDDKA